jgi:hypothetical protein
MDLTRKGNTMKKSAVFGLALILALFSVVLAQSPKNVPEAESLATAQGKLILMEFSTSW